MWVVVDLKRSYRKSLNEWNEWCIWYTVACRSWAQYFMAIGWCKQACTVRSKHGFIPTEQQQQITCEFISNTADDGNSLLVEFLRLCIAHCQQHSRTTSTMRSRDGSKTARRTIERTVTMLDVCWKWNLWRIEAVMFTWYSQCQARPWDGATKQL